MQKHVVSVGFDIPGDAYEYADFDSDTSLLDADIIVFAPNLENYTVDHNFQGRSRLDNDDSGRIQIDAAHWNRELSIALEAGKTVFIVMLGVESVYVHTGQTTYSGSGRNARPTHHVDLFDPYSLIPIPELQASTQRRAGNRMKTAKEVGPLAAYWQEFGNVTYYQAYLDKPIGSPALVTQTGDKMVGGVVRFKEKKGIVVLLPCPNLYAMVEQRGGKAPAVVESLVAAVEDATTADGPSEAERSVGNQFISALVEIDKSLRAGSERTPTPIWANEQSYEMKEEVRLRVHLSNLEARITELEKEKVDTETALQTAGSLKGLLFEKGKPLEFALQEALRVIGFTAEGYVDDESEFDVVLKDASGRRLIGEAEGKDERAINIDKLDQLSRNIEEDFAKQPDNAEYAKGVLFGNAFRLSPPAERGDFFTPKCLSGAKRLGVALVKTPDLFHVAKFLKEHSDFEFATSCRDAIINTDGQGVVFPPLPITPEKTENARPSSTTIGSTK